ncbi:cysteine-rich receptor-like protein kinase 4 isoform X3 [Medicago truncatula]|uniref:cysteine-rich receptor-like protein kinase 4 isoform X3 n=1 Tax=Medicago truncatula TaxID=3880 RepID=UPI001967320E|nr:cysteine-rich receptor-like protein kinase 4 isoform X3 [Medicago truncatula]
MAYSKILHFSILVISLLFSATIMAQDSPLYLNTICPNNVTKPSSTFQSNLLNLFSSLSSKAKGNTKFYNHTVTSINPSESVYGSFMCRGDIPSLLCQDCIVKATNQLSSACSLSKQAVIWYGECMVRYSNISFFSTIDMMPGFHWCNTANVTNTKSFVSLLFTTMNRTVDEAASPLIGDKNEKFATKEAQDSENQTLYCLAQCTPDLSPNDCRTCLSSAIEKVSKSCDGKVGGRFLYPSCNVRYELYPFYRSITVLSPNELAPRTNDSKQDSKLSEESFYLSYNCSRNHNTITDKNIKLLLSYLLSNATIGKKFHSLKVEEIVYGLFMCRGDLPSRLCVQCVKNATEELYSKCQYSPQGIIWYSHCLLRYSNQYFFNHFETRPMFSDINVTNDPIPDQNLFTNALSNQLSELVNVTGNNDEKFTTNSLILNDKQTLYTVEQCTKDLSTDECNSCLNDMISKEIPWSFLGSVGGRILYPSCNLRFELFKFYMDGDEALLPTRHAEKKTIIFIVVPIIILVMLFSIGYFLIKRWRRKSRKTILRENFGEESATLEPLQFDWMVIEAATNNFSKDNYLGKGGFGEVYKILNSKSC